MLLLFIHKAKLNSSRDKQCDLKTSVECLYYSKSWKDKLRSFILVLCKLRALYFEHFHPHFCTAFVSENIQNKVWLDIFPTEVQQKLLIFSKVLHIFISLAACYRKMQGWPVAAIRRIQDQPLYLLWEGLGVSLSTYYGQNPEYSVMENTFFWKKPKLLWFVGLSLLNYSTLSL